MLFQLLFCHMTDLFISYGPPHEGHYFTNHPVIIPNPLTDLSTIPNCLQTQPFLVRLHQSIVLLFFIKECKSFSSYALSDGLPVLRCLLLLKLPIICGRGTNFGIAPL